MVTTHNIYLGLPTFSTRNKRLQIGFLNDRLFKKIAGWSPRLFSKGGREALIKSVLQAVPTYAMSCFQRVSIEKWRTLWWHSGGVILKTSIDSTGLRAQSWVRQLEQFNKALLAKQLWRFVEEPDSMVARLVKARYFKHVDRLNPCYGWRSLTWDRDLLFRGIAWRVGNGDSIRPFDHSWFPGLNSGRLMPRGQWVSSVRDFISTDVRAKGIIKIQWSFAHTQK